MMYNSSGIFNVGITSALFWYKGYSVDVDTEARVIQRAAIYHRAWREAKEESGLLPLIFLFLCKVMFLC